MRELIVLQRSRTPFFRKKFQKKINETITSKKKTKKLLKEYTKPTPAKRPYHDGYRLGSSRFVQDPHPSLLR